MSYHKDYTVDGLNYFPPPYSLNGLGPVLSAGIIPLGVLAVISVASTASLISFICYRLVTWRMYYRSFLGYNQYVVLVLNLLLADLQQASAFLITFHWLRKDQILAPTPACFAQGWLIHSGDVSSGFFVFAIAVHTFYTVVFGKRVGNRTFMCIILVLWVFAYALTGMGVAIHRDRYYTRAGAWCWVSPAFGDDRLAFHYIWVFFIQFGTILLYFTTFYQLRKKTSQLFQDQQVGQNAPNMATVEAVNRITKLMTLYPCVYVVLLLPLSAGRMWSYAHDGQGTSEVFNCIAGCFLVSCGWVDTLLYTLTRRRLLKDTMPSHSSRDRAASDWDGNELGSKGITHTRTVTVENGNILDIINEERALAQTNRGGRHRGSSERTPSPTESIDPILSGQNNGLRTKTEVSAGLHGHGHVDDADKGENILALPPMLHVRHGPG